MHIAINHKSGIPYASLMNSVREGSRVRKVTVAYLGRVLDPELPPQFLYYTSKTSFRPKEVFFTIPCFS